MIYRTTRQQTVSNLRVIAAVAAKLADDIEANQIWNGDISAGLGQIDKARGDIPRSLR